MKFRVVALWAGLLLLLPVRLHAHAHLASSKPAKGDTVRAALHEIVLHFTEAVAERFTVISLLDASGHDITFGTTEAVGGSPSKTYRLRLQHPLMAGAFTVKWKVAGTDGHGSTGMFDFSVDVADAIKPVPNQPVVSGPGATLTPSTPAQHAQHAAAAEIAPLYRPDTSPVWIVTRWLNFIALMLLVGAVAFRFGVLNRARFNDESFTLEVDDGARQLAIIAGVTVLITSALRLWLQSGSLNGPDRMFQPDALKSIIFKTGWGKAWLAQTIAALGFTIAASIRTEERNESWYTAAAFAIIAAATPAFSGHAAAVQQAALIPVLDDAVHVISASAWLGTLLFVIAVGTPAALRSGRGAERTATFIHTFSPLALTMAMIAMFTGALNAFVQITAFSDLWSTRYGRVLALKIGLVLLTAAAGAYNWRVARPRLGDDSATVHVRRSATTELIVGAVIIAVTAILVGTPN